MIEAADIEFARRKRGSGKVVLALACGLWAVELAAAEPPAQDKPTLLIVVGAPGEEEFGDAFSKWARVWDKAAAEAGAKLVSIGQKPVEGVADRERLQQAL